MSAVLQQQPTSSWGFATFNRMSSVEELDSSLTLLSRHAVLASTRAMVTPPGSPSTASTGQNSTTSSSLGGRSPRASTSSINSGATTSSVDSPKPTFDFVPPNTPIHPLAIAMNNQRRTVTGTTASAIPASANVAAIDNKIEQAMDLVKTHLTFAVREEVEVLRQTIAELELKVLSLEEENQLLRQYAPADVVANLPQLVAQHRTTNPIASTPAPTLPPPLKVPAELSTVSSFESTLHSVVADVRHEISGGASGIVRK